MTSYFDVNFATKSPGVWVVEVPIFVGAPAALSAACPPFTADRVSDDEDTFFVADAVFTKLLLQDAGAEKLSSVCPGL